MAENTELCVVCEQPTGKAGRDEDSLYVTDAVGAELGPLCDGCHAMRLFHPERSGGAWTVKDKATLAAEIACQKAIIDKLVEVCQEMRATLHWSDYDFYERVDAALAEAEKETGDDPNNEIVKGAFIGGHYLTHKVLVAHFVSTFQEKLRLEAENARQKELIAKLAEVLRDAQGLLDTIRWPDVAIDGEPPGEACPVCGQWKGHRERCEWIPTTEKIDDALAEAAKETGDE